MVWSSLQLRASGSRLRDEENGRIEEIHRRAFQHVIKGKEHCVVKSSSKLGHVHPKILFHMIYYAPTIIVILLYYYFGGCRAIVFV